MNSTFRTISAVSLAAFIMLSSTSPAIAGSHKDAAHQNAPGQIKKIAQQSVNTQATPTPELPTQASQVVETKLAKNQSNLTINSQTTYTQPIQTNSNHQKSHNQSLLGSNGTVKVGDYVLGNGPDGNSGNKPHLPCKFQIEAYGFDSGVKKVNYVITTQAPTQPKSKVVATGSFNLDLDSNSYGASNRGYDGKVVLDLSNALKNYSAHEKQGYHVKVEITFDGQPSQAGKHKVFWVEKCATDVASTPTPTPEQGQTLSTNTNKPTTGVMGTSIERDSHGQMPNTGGNGTAAAQALGIILIATGAIALQVRKIQAEITSQMSL